MDEIKPKESLKKNENKKNIDKENLTVLLDLSSEQQQQRRIYSNDDNGDHNDYDDGRSSISLSDLRQHDIDIIKIVYENEDENTIATFSFNGLKGMLKLHQEILSRSLRRLQELGLIQRTKLGYRSTREGKAIFSKLKYMLKNRLDEKNARGDQIKYNQIFQVYVPYNLVNQKIVQKISGKWFDSLRWMGMVQTLTGYQLKWKDIEHSIEIIVYLSENNIIIETNDNPLNISKAFGYSTKIIESIGDIVSKNNLLIYPIKNNDYNNIHN